ncbi:uracil-DNA glycosylase [bacterium]|nr:uracil-DNA glycosylase [bacterium]
MTTQRMLRQRLEDLRRAGVTHVPAGVSELVAAIALPAESHRPAKPATATRAQVASMLQHPASSSRPQPAAVGSADSPPVRRSTIEATPVARTPAAHAPVRQFAQPSAALPKKYSADMSDPQRPCSTLSRSERETQLTSLADRVAACIRCQELAETRTQTVFGVGNPEADIMFLGEAPGADEDRQGEPFVGRAGKLLNDIITACRLTREEVYICNILRCRPPGNRTPNPQEAANCREFLDGQIEIVNPKYIICWGSCAAQNLLDTKAAIGKLRGEFFDYKGIKVLCTYHPSYLLRQPAAKKDVWEDMKFFRADMGVKL